ncbi:hypothetical protein G7048_27465 (plasmid) [Diaphorobacter sp. HDW4B]|uniref:DUF6493 family protein n=1 Tax=Diaphorobacter sp. HDW4B TaxID=2714925 RepID=UPI0014097F7B|nr:DUF6493 family protein [Diaphorobacter sp. HDW4B]QIL74212.1 hypothetical protein G7048_27465 [Diaphorobacter sp. HDW4B]
MSLDLSARRALLRDAEKERDVNDYAAFARAVEGADEEERAALAKTLAPSRLYKAEGATPRACYVLAALGKPKLLVETLDKSAPSAEQPIREAARGRSHEWVLQFCDQIVDTYAWSREPMLKLSLLMQSDRGVIADSPIWLKSVPSFVSADIDKALAPAAAGQRIVERLDEHGGLLMHSFWRFFETEGLGAHWTLTQWLAEGWDAAVVQLSESRPGCRDRLLDASLGALLRDFAATQITWYPRVQRLLDPGTEEIIARQQSYLAVLATAPSTAVGLAQDLLAKAVSSDAFDAAALVDASAAVLVRKEKKLIKAQLKLLAELQASDRQVDAISQVVADVVDAMPLDLVPLARKLMGSAEDAKSVKTVPPSSAAAVTVPGPRRTPTESTATATTPAPINDDKALFALVAEHLEGMGNGADYPRLFDYLARHSPTALPPELQKRAAEVIDSVWDERIASPRRLLAAALLGRDQVAFRGYAKFVVATKGQPDPEGAQLKDQSMTSSRYDPETGDWKVDEVWTSRTGYQYLETHSPLALLADAFKILRLGLKRGKAFSTPEVVPPHPFVWQRVVHKAGDGTFSRDLEVLGDGPKPFWLASGAQEVTSTHPALDVAPIPFEFTFRAQEAREQDGYDQIVQWAAWLLKHHPDTLAAHFHPMLSAAVQVINVRGVGALLAALGESSLPPHGPVYSALALAASAKMPEHRAQAAESIAKLADSGLLDPSGMATQIAAHLADDFVVAGRLAQTLADAASISAIAGYRVMQTVEALLPHLMNAEGKPVTQAAKLVELAARLSSDYGTPLTIPALLDKRRKGSSVLAAALQVLAAVQPHATALAEEAAAEAANAAKAPSHVQSTREATP